MASSGVPTRARFTYQRKRAMRRTHVMNPARTSTTMARTASIVALSAATKKVSQPPVKTSNQHVAKYSPPKCPTETGSSITLVK